MILKHYGASGRILSEHEGVGVTVDKSLDPRGMPARTEFVIIVRRDHDTRGTTLRIRDVEITMNRAEAIGVFKQLLDALI